MTAEGSVIPNIESATSVSQWEKKAYNIIIFCLVNLVPFSTTGTDPVIG